MSKEQTVIWVDEEDHELGFVPRKKAHTEGLLHRIAVVYVVREDGKILVQERLSGRLDHSAAGHVDPREDYISAAKRELEEEIGIKNVELHELGKMSASQKEPEVDNAIVRYMFNLFELRTDAYGILGADEVKGVFWADPKEIYEEMKADPANEKFVGGFKASLRFYLQNKKML